MIIVPSHEQLYPGSKIPHRLEEYVRDGLPPTTNRAAAARILTGREVMDAINTAKLARKMVNIATRYYVGTCFHEAGCLNEWDTEVATKEDATGYQSVGPYQIGAEEASRYGYKLIDMLDLAKSSDCMVQLAEHNLAVIQSACQVASARGKQNCLDYTDPAGNFWEGGTLRAYLAICHNKGGGFVHATIGNYGLDWTRYKQRNPHDDIVAHGYGEDCITGGPNWPAQP